MAKLKTPLLSLSASGSIGDVLSFANSSGQNLVRTKPSPTDPKSLAQMYHRWDYQDYAEYWHSLTPAQKQTWETNARRLKITGFNYWMRTYLNTLPDIAARWRLDEPSGIIAYDSSKYATNGTISGASPTTGLIGGARHFITDDYIEITCPQCNFTSGDFSIVARIIMHSLSAHNNLFCRGLFNADGYRLRILSTGRIHVDTFQTPGDQHSNSSDGDILINTPYTIGLSRSGASCKLFKDGIDITAFFGVHVDPAASTRTGKIGIYDTLLHEPFDGVIDDLTIYNRALTPQEHLMRSGRRYPL